MSREQADDREEEDGGERDGGGVMRPAAWKQTRHTDSVTYAGDKSARRIEAEREVLLA